MWENAPGKGVSMATTRRGIEAVVWGMARGGFAALLLSAAPAHAQSVGAAASFAIVGGSAVAANGTGSVVDGDVGVSPGTSITGFPANASIVPPFTTHADPDGLAIAAQTSVTALYTTLAGAGPCTPLGMQLDTVSVGPGVYCFTTTADLAANGTFTLNGAGTYIFQVGSALTANVLSNVVLLNGADPCDVFWQVTSAATLNGSTFAGNVVAQAGVSMGAGTVSLPVALQGRALATAAGPVTLAGFDTIGGCSEAATPTVTSTATDTASATVTATATDTPTATDTATPTDTFTPVDTASATATPTDTGTPTSTATATSSGTGTATTTATATVTSSPTATQTATSSDTPTATATPTASSTATATPTHTDTRTATPTRTPGPPILTITKTTTSRAEAGATVIYTLTYANTGGTTATSVVITEAVPDHTTFNAAASSSGWSCADGSPPMTVCMLSVANIAPGGHASVLFAVTVDTPPGASLIRNTVTIAAAGGAGGSATVVTLVGAAPAPALQSLGFVAALAILLAVAGVSMRRRADASTRE